MHCLPLCVIAGYAVLFIIPLASAHSTRTTTTTVTSTTTVFSSTATHTFHQHHHGKNRPTRKTRKASKDIESSTAVTVHTVSQSSSSSTASTSTSQPASGYSMPSIEIGPSGSYRGYLLREAVINSTNYYRAQHLAQPVNWNHTLASYAQDYAAKCLWQHSGGPYGENLAAGFANPTLAVDAWGNEEPDYNYEARHFSEKSGHFTQLVWKATKSVGCGAVMCENHVSGGTVGWYLVCEYWPPGNVEGAFGENVGKAGQGKDGKPGFGGASRRIGIGSGWRAVGLVMLMSILTSFVC